ncbi:MAG: DUF2332 family protein [Tabrizicola sp.]|nr:DUF2332 family protein [Tabrizicola sp.]
MSRVRDAFRKQSAVTATMGSPFTAALLGGLAEGLEPDGVVAAAVLNWPGDPYTRADALPLRLAGGLRALVLSGQDAELSAAYARAGAGRPARETPLPPEEARPLTIAALAAMRRHEDFLIDWLKSPPQTNEVRRSGPLIAAGHWLTARFGLPLVLSELGASAGLNLLWDRYALDIGAVFGPADPALVLTPAWEGAPPPRANPVILARSGVDLNPLDAVEDRLRLVAYLWADQPDRLERTAKALDLAAAMRPGIARGDAADWLLPRLQTRHPGAVHVVFHTVAWQYFPAEVQARARALLDAAGAAATADAPLAHLSMEADDMGPGAALTLRLWPGNEDIALGRADFHGRWVRWTAPALVTGAADTGPQA